jgi:hypothetical protein
VATATDTAVSTSCPDLGDTAYASSQAGVSSC